MKKFKLITLIIIILLSSSNNSYCKPYNYPVLPGDKEWKEATTYLDKVKLCNIPENILQNMTTQDLLISMFNFPFSQNLIIYDNFIEGYEGLKSIFNCLNELEKRRDAPEVLFNAYIKSNLNNNMANDIILENLISLPCFLEKLNNTQKRELIDTSLSKLGNRLVKKNFLNEKSKVSCSFLLIRILSYLDNIRFEEILDENDEVKKFCETSQYPEKKTINKIIFEIIRFKQR